MSAPLVQDPRVSAPPLAPEQVVRLAFLIARRRIPAHAARDVAQETWLKAQRHAAGSPAWTEAACRAWIRCVAANAALDHLRRSQRAPAPLEGELAVEADPAQALERAEAQQLEREEARRLLAGLSRDERELLAWRAIEGGAWAELAERRGEPASTLRARYSRLCASLRKESPRG